MTKFKLHKFFKQLLPITIRRIIRGMFSYYQRVSVWPIILWQVRGVTWNDKWSLYKSAMAAPILAFDNLLVWQDPILLTDINASIKNIGKFHLRKKSDDLYHVTPWREKAVFNKICELLKEGDVFIDAGANIGFFSILASRLVGVHGRVLSVEMIPDTADQLESHVQLNNLSNVTIIRNALSDVCNKSLIAMVEPGRFGRASVSVVHKEALQILVLTTTLDEISRGLETVKLLKMDIEGSEYQALLGGESLLKRTENIIYEKWHSDVNSQDLVSQFLVKNCFTTIKIDGSNYLATLN